MCVERFSFVVSFVQTRTRDQRMFFSVLRQATDRLSQTHESTRDTPPRSSIGCFDRKMQNAHNREEGRDAIVSSFSSDLDLTMHDEEGEGKH